MESSSNLKFEYNFLDLEILQIPNNAAVKNGVVVLTGGYDHQGRPTIVFPIDMNLKIQMSQVTTTELLEAILYYWGIIRIPDKAAGVAFLIDFRAGSITIIDTIISSINAFKTQYPQSIGNVYIIRPQERELSNRLKIQLGLKKLNLFSRVFSNKETVTCTAQFQSVLVKNSSDLTKYIDQNLLIGEFGGSLCYDHETWIFFKQDLDKYLGDVLHIKKGFPDSEEKILLLKEYENKESFLAPEEAIPWLRRRFEEILLNSRLENLFIETDAFLIELSPSATGLGSSKYSALKGNPHIDNNRLFINSIRAKLVEIQNHFQTLLSQAEKKVNISKEFKEIKKYSGEVTKWIQNFGIPNLEVPPNIASNLNEAELVARDFHSQMFIPGMKSISQCNGICQDMEKISEDSEENTFIRSQYIHKLLTTITTFNDNLQNRRKLYSDVYQFFLILNRVIIWLKRTINSLALELLNYHENMNDTEPLPLGNAWKTRIHQYLLKHPAPKLHQINLIEKLTPLMKDINIRNEARLLTHRLRVILKLLSGEDVIVADVREVIEWKERLKADVDVKKQLEEVDYNEELAQSTTNLFMKFESQNFNVDNIEHQGTRETNAISKPSNRHQISKTYNPPRIRTSPHYNKNISKGYFKQDQSSRSQPKLFTRSEDEEENMRRKELILLAEKSVRDSLEDTHLISEKDIRISSKCRDEEELSIILNQLLYDINSQNDSTSQKSSRNPSSLQDLNNYSHLPKNPSPYSFQQRKNVDYF